MTTVLVVDDDNSKRYVIRSWLSRAGYQITEAATGAQALEAVHRTPVDLVVLDVRLPDASGFQICEQIKADPRTAALPVIHVSATAISVADRTQGLTRGADAYLAEPIDPDELVATVAAVLRYYRARLRAERLAGRLARLVETTTAINAAPTFAALLRAAATGTARVFGGAAAVAASFDGAALAAQVAGPEAEPLLRPARPRFFNDPLGGEIGVMSSTVTDAAWSTEDVRLVTVRVKEERDPVYVAVTTGVLDEDDEPLLRQLGQALTLAVEAMRSYDAERRIALTLQRSLLPQRLPVVPGVDLAVRYHPASEHAEVGGDFYELVVVDGGLFVAIGDVAGHSLHAATVMAELRHALRAYLAEGHGPGAALDRLNNLILRFLPNEIATMCLLLLDPDTGEVRLSNAGHLPPVLAAGASVSTVGTRVPLLGVPVPHDREQQLSIPPGGTLVLVTDGLIERRGEVIDDGLARLCAAMAEVEPDLEDFCDRLLAEFGGPARDDDVALVALRRRAG